MNNEKILTVADHIEKDDRHNQLDFFHSCGTPCCVAGWGCSLDGWEVSPKTDKDGDKKWVTKDGKTEKATIVARKIFGMKKKTAKALFMYYASSEGAKTASQLRKLVGMGEDIQKKIVNKFVFAKMG